MKKILLSSLMICLIIFTGNTLRAQTCTACFTATPDTNNTQLINLDATCSNANPGTLYEWYVDGSLYSIYPSPTFQIPFLVSGQYTIQLIITDMGCSDTTSQIIFITPTCSANFTIYNNFGGGLFYFYPNMSWSPTATFSWDYGDGNTSTGISGMNNYLNSGTYNVCCIITDTAFGGCSDTACQIINVNSSYSCQADFYYNLTLTNPTTGSLYADAQFFSLYDPNNYSMNWYLNGALVQQGTSTSYNTILTATGLYDLKLVISDTNMVSCDSLTQIIFFNGGFIPNPNCYPCFTTLYNVSYDSIYFDASCSNIPLGGSLVWNINGSVFTDPGIGFMQGFAFPGTQYITLYAVDSNGVNCDSLFQFVYTITPPCSSCLTVSQIIGSTSDYTFDGSCTASATSYNWFVDNAFIITTSNPQFNYSFSQSGTYSVCLQTSDAMGNLCNQSCTTVVVTTPTATQFDLSGKVYQVDNSYNYSLAGNGDAKVYLIKLMTGGILDAVDSTTTDAFGSYSFNNKPIDDYRIKVALNPSATNYATNIPTYYNSALMWYNAQVVTLFGNTYNKDIYMSYGTNPGGTGFISGNVFLGSNKPARGGSEEVTLILIDQTTQLPAAYAKPNSNGDYTFTNIPFGNYKIFGELLNRASIPDDIVISATQTSFTNKNFVYNDNVVKPTNQSLSVKDVEAPLTLMIAPNPAQNSFNINNTGKQRSLRIMDMTGRTIQKFDLKSNENKAVDCSRWQRGIYLVEDIQAGQKRTYKLNIN
ncbi:MAG TPA: PKD domain-containing protein [Chitinophagaceae bacterium]|nr:PKD domain-containing protein [Chitinophagaceae bacterium]